MNIYEKVVHNLWKQGISVFEDRDLPEHYDGAVREYEDGTRIILIDKSVVTIREKLCVITEEMGHIKMNIGDITDTENINNMRQEKKGRAWGICKRVPLENIIEARKEGIRNGYELAQYLDVTEDYLYESLQVYKSRYGKNVRVDDVILDLDTLEAIQVLAEGEEGTNNYVAEQIKKNRRE